MDAILPAARDYSLIGRDSQRAVETGLAAAEWYHTDVSRKDMKELMKRDDGPAIRDTAIWLGSMVILAVPGHTPGETALLVRLPKTGAVLLSGDVVHFNEQWEKQGVPTFNADRADTLASMARLQAVAAELKAILVVQHEPADIAKLPVFPKSAR